jgi:hypothetical protein
MEFSFTFMYLERPSLHFSIKSSSLQRRNFPLPAATTGTRDLLPCFFSAVRSCHRAKQSQIETRARLREFETEPPVLSTSRDKSPAQQHTPVRRPHGTSHPTLPPTMATASNSGAGQKQASSSSSRFASLKVFKFAAGSSKHHHPPVPPPKDNAPTNSSWTSLTPDPSTPMTPVFSDYTRSQSTPPYSAAHSPALSSLQDPSPASSSSSSSTSFGKGLIKFAKRSLTPKMPTRQLSESSSEDSSISLPWNFQVCLTLLIALLFLQHICCFSAFGYRPHWFLIIDATSSFSFLLLHAIAVSPMCIVA